MIWRQFKRQRMVLAFDGEPRFALITVNYSTTRYLKLMLLTLAEQSSPQLLKRIILVDNRSRDGGPSFIRELAERTNRISLVENRWFLNHARGMRRGLRLLDMVEADLPATDSANIVLSCDADVVFRRRDTLWELARVFVEEGAALAGELRKHLYRHPEAQASFIAHRRAARLLLSKRYRTVGQSRLSRLLDAAEHLARRTAGSAFSQPSWRIHPSSGPLGCRRSAASFCPFHLTPPLIIHFVQPPSFANPSQGGPSQRHAREGPFDVM
jgi:glycosyltransferase involved in cell wall biosynthesis